MRARLTGVSAALALVVLTAIAPAAGAQDPLPTATPTVTPAPTPTPTVTPTPTPTPRERRDARDRKRKVIRRIYRDFEKDGRIEVCDHTPKALKIALRSISDEYAQDFPDFKDALKAAIQKHRRKQCVPTPTPTPTPTVAPAPTNPAPVTPAPVTPLPTSTPQSGQIPGFGGSFDDGSGGSIKKPKNPKPTKTPTPAPGEGAIPEGTPAPTATPASTAVPPPKLVVTRASADPNLFVPGTMLAIALLGLLFAALSAVAARRSGRFAGVGHAWREAGWRASGAWAEFRDWLRLGR